MLWRRGGSALPDQDAITVREAFAAEAPHLLKLPDNPYPVVEQVAVAVGKTPYITSASIRDARAETQATECIQVAGLKTHTALRIPCGNWCCQGPLQLG